MKEVSLDSIFRCSFGVTEHSSVKRLHGKEVRLDTFFRNSYRTAHPEFLVYFLILYLMLKSLNSRETGAEHQFTKRGLSLSHGDFGENI